jgi:hypothetical protein
MRYFSKIALAAVLSIAGTLCQRANIRTDDDLARSAVG